MIQMRISLPCGQDQSHPMITRIYQANQDSFRRRNQLVGDLDYQLRVVDQIQDHRKTYGHNYRFGMCC